MYTNKINGKKYIGQTTRPEKRRIEHLSHSLNKGTTAHFYNSIRKYGWKNFEYTILEEISKNNIEALKNALNNREIFWINYYDSTNKSKGYNFSLGGDSRGIYCRKIQMYSKDGTFIKMYKNYHEIIEEFGGDASSLYRMINNENSLFRNKYVLLWEGEEFKYKGGKKSKHIYYQMDLDGNIVKTWDSVRDIEKNLGYDSSSIIKCCNHPDTHKTSHGFKWFRAKTI
jgi:hypothetical protein